MIKIFSTELNFSCLVCAILDIYFEFINKQGKILENEYDSQFEDYRDPNEDEKYNPDLLLGLI